LILSGRQFDAKEALDLGLVNRIVTGNKLLKEAIALAEELAQKPPLTLAAALWAIHRGMDAQLTTGLPSKKPPSRALCRRTMPMKAWRPS
jgi:enoyl-CoA hydratase